MSAGPVAESTQLHIKLGRNPSLDDREFRGILRSTQRKVVFYGSVTQPTRGLFRRVKRISPGDRDSLAEGGEFELPVPISKP